MFNIKQFVTRMTNDGNRNERDGGSSDQSASFVENEEQHSAEGFLCPPCMKAFPSAEALEEHYNKTHVEDVTPPEASGNSNGEVQILKEEIQNLQFSLADEKANSEELRKEMLKLQADLNSKEFDAASLRSQEKEFEDSKSLLISEVTLLRQQLAESLEQISILRKQNETAAANAQLCFNENESLKNEISSLETQLSHRNSIDDAEVLRQELVSVQKLMNQMSLDKEKEIETLNNRLNELLRSPSSDKVEDELDQARAEIQMLKESRAAADDDRNELTKSYNEEISKKSSKISEVENLSQMRQEKIEKLEEERDRLRTEYSELCNKIEKGEGAEAALKSLQKENDTLKTNVDNLYVKNSELLSKLEEAKKVSEEFSQKTEQAKKETESVRKEYNEIVASKDAMIKQMEGERAKDLSTINNLRNGTEDLQKKVAQSEEKIVQLSTLNKKLHEKEELSNRTAKEQAGQIENLKQELKSVESMKVDLEKTLETCKNEIKTTQSSMNALQVSLTESKKELEQTKLKFENDMKTIEVKLKDEKGNHARTSQQLESVKKALEDQSNTSSVKIDELEGELAKQKAELEQSKRLINELNEQCSEGEQKLQLLQSKIDEIIQQKIQLEQTCESNEEEKTQLLEKLISNESEAKALNVTIEELSRKRDDAMAALQELGRENQSLQIEMAKIQGRKWADDSNVSNCSSCSKEFTLTNRKHHCRHCGQIFCNDCSSKSASVPSSKKPVRVCDGCFVKLTSP